MYNIYHHLTSEKMPIMQVNDGNGVCVRVIENYIHSRTGHFCINYNNNNNNSILLLFKDVKMKLCLCDHHNLHGFI